MPVRQTLSKFLLKLRFNEKIWSHTGDQQKVKFLKVINNLIIYKYNQESINHKKKTNRVVVFSCRCVPNILKCYHHSLNQEIKTHWDTNWKIQLIHMKFQFHSSSELPLEHNENQKPASNQIWLWSYLTKLSVKRISCSFSLGIKGREDNVINVKHPVK